MFQAAYQFFDQSFVLESDSAAFLAQFDAAYGRFRLPEPRAERVARVLLGNHSEATIGDQTVHIDDPAILELYAVNAILRDVTSRVHSHYLFHAAALSTPGEQGVLLAGASGLGKTTLTLALLDRGWTLLSDEIAAVDRATGWLHPFPRSLGMRVTGGRPWEKLLIPAEAIAAACPARVLFALADSGTNVAPGDPWYLTLDRAGEELIYDLAALPGVRAACCERGEPYPVVRLDVAPRALPAVEQDVEATCRRHGRLLFDFSQGRERPADFHGEPQLEPLLPSEAARELLAHLKGGRGSELLRQEFGGSAARLYVALASLLSRTDCFRLRVGRLESMVEAIQRVAGEGSG